MGEGGPSLVGPSILGGARLPNDPLALTTVYNESLRIRVIGPDRSAEPLV